MRAWVQRSEIRGQRSEELHPACTAEPAF
jgi:hypothetical protein